MADDLEFALRQLLKTVYGRLQSTSWTSGGLLLAIMPRNQYLLTTVATSTSGKGDRAKQVDPDAEA